MHPCSQILEEFCDSHDAAEASHCLRSLGVPFFHHELVKQVNVHPAIRVHHAVNVHPACHALGICCRRERAGLPPKQSGSLWDADTVCTVIVTKNRGLPGTFTAASAAAYLAAIDLLPAMSLQSNVSTTSTKPTSCVANKPCPVAANCENVVVVSTCK